MVINSAFIIGYRYRKQTWLHSRYVEWLVTERTTDFQGFASDTQIDQHLWVRVMFQRHSLLSSLWPPRRDQYNRRRRLFATIMDWSLQLGVTSLATHITMRSYGEVTSLTLGQQAITSLISASIAAGCSVFLLVPIECLLKCTGRVSDEVSILISLAHHACDSPSAPR